MFLDTTISFQVFIAKKQIDICTRTFVEHPFNEKLEITTNGTFFNEMQRNN